MPLSLDVRLLNGDADNFSVKMMRLYAKADPSNRARIEQGFPNLVATYEAWHKSGNIPDLPYDGKP